MDDGPLEAASIGYEMSPNDFALRCNIINVNDGIIITHNGGDLETEDADVLIKYLNEKLASQYPGIVKFITGIQYRHLLIIKGGNKYVDCAPPHDHPVTMETTSGKTDGERRCSIAQLHMIKMLMATLSTRWPTNIA